MEVKREDKVNRKTDDFATRPCSEEKIEIIKKALNQIAAPQPR